MSLLSHGGRIVPILTGHDQHIHSNSSDEQPSLNTIPPISSCPTSSLSLLDQQQHASTLQQKMAMDSQSLEMPCLRERGLFALPTDGDGNCLYYSLSDQLHGTFHHANEIRQILADHMENNKPYFMQFVVAQGGERRRPKRAAVSAYATRSADVSAPSEEDKEQRFKEMVALTRKNGEWGSSEHLQAFCQVYRVDMNVYTMDGVQVFRDVYAPPGEHRDVIHVAFHDFKHYSSVRPVAGHHTGLLIRSKHVEPHITAVEKNSNLEAGGDAASSALTDDKSLPVDITSPSDTDNLESQPPTLSASNSFTSISTTDTQPPSNSTSITNPDLAVDVYPPWDIQSIQDGLGGRYDRETIVDMLQKCRGDIDRAFSALLDEKNDGEKKLTAAPSLKPNLHLSRSSSPFSTGSKRSADDDSDDSEDPRPAIRRGRPRKRLVSNLTLGVGISFRDDQNEVVSLNLRMNSDAEKAAQEQASQAAEKQADATAGETDSAQSDTSTRKGPRRSGRLSKARPTGANEMALK